MMRSLTIALSGCLLGIALHASWGTRPADELMRQADAQAARCPAPDQAPQHCDCASAMADARAAVTAANRPAGAAGAPAPSVTSGAPEPVAADEEAKEALATETHLMERALQSGAWTDEDANALRLVLPKLSNEDRPKALQGLAQAINAGRLKLEARFPF